MKIAVLVSLVPDSTTKIKINTEKNQIDETGVTFILNPYDEFAVEEAVRLKEKNGGEVYAISFGNEKSKEAIKKAFQMGADKGILINAKETTADSYVTAMNLADVLKEINPDIIFTGKQSIDFDSMVIPKLVSEILNIPSINIVTKLEINGTKVIAEREVEGGIETIESQLPILIGTQKGINEPRYPNLKSIMASKSKPIEEKQAKDYKMKTTVVKMSYPPEKSQGKIFDKGLESIPELVKLLREEAKVI